MYIHISEAPHMRMDAIHAHQLGNATSTILLRSLPKKHQDCGTAPLKKAIVETSRTIMKMTARGESSRFRKSYRSSVTTMCFLVLSSLLVDTAFRSAGIMRRMSVLRAGPIVSMRLHLVQMLASKGARSLECRSKLS